MYELMDFPCICAGITTHARMHQFVYYDLLNTHTHTHTHITQVCDLTRFNQEQKAMLLKEVELLKLMDHPNIIRVYVYV